MDLLVPSDKHTTCPYKGEASYWSVHAGGKVAEDAVWSYPEPLADAPPLAGYIAFYWNKMDEWFEEDEPAIIHARDPYHRIDVLDTSRHVRVSVDGEEVADTTRARVLFETGLPTALVLPARGRADGPARGHRHAAPAAPTRATRPTGPWATRRTSCGRIPTRGREAARIKDYLAFFNERVDIEVDGELQERPVTQWSKSRRTPAAASS